jgi:hypothetical protein
MAAAGMKMSSAASAAPMTALENLRDDPDDINPCILFLPSLLVVFFKKSDRSFWLFASELVRNAQH